MGRQWDGGVLAATNAYSANFFQNRNECFEWRERNAGCCSINALGEREVFGFFWSFFLPESLIIRKKMFTFAP